MVRKTGKDGNFLDSQFYIRPDQKEWLLKHIKPGVSQSDLVRAALDDYIKKLDKDK